MCINADIYMISIILVYLHAYIHKCFDIAGNLAYILRARDINYPLPIHCLPNLSITGLSPTTKRHRKQHPQAQFRRIPPPIPPRPPVSILKSSNRARHIVRHHVWEPRSSVRLSIGFPPPTKITTSPPNRSANHFMSFFLYNIGSISMCSSTQPLCPMTSPRSKRSGQHPPH